MHIPQNTIGSFVALGFLMLAVSAPAAAMDGPTPPPANVKEWPGQGPGSVYDSWSQRRQQFWRERANDQGAVVFFGDSITQGFTALQAAFPGVKVANRGIGGDTSRGLLVRLREDVLDLKPRAVVILIGINDLTSGGTPTDVATNVRLILDAIRKNNPKTPVVLCHVMPCSIRPQYPATLRQTNALYDGIAMGRPNVTVCDTWPGLATPDGMPIAGLFPDGVHLNRDGYKVWETNLRPALQHAGVLPADDAAPANDVRLQ